MKKVLSLVKPDVKTVDLKKHAPMCDVEKVKYLSIPDCLSLKALKGDIRLGEAQFKELVPLLEKENVPRYILITTESTEAGYQAVTYLAGALNKKCGKEYSSEECIISEDEEENEHWEENAYFIPIITKNDLEVYMGNGDSSFPFSNQLFMGQQHVLCKTPFWTECRREAICILCERESMGFSVMREDNALYEGLEKFCDNSQIYILNIEPSYRFAFTWSDEEEYGTEVSAVELRPEWNSIILNYAADEANIKMTEEIAKKYYQRALISIANEKGYLFEERFRF